LPYHDPAHLLYVTETTPEIPRGVLSYPDYVDWKKLNRVFDSLDVYNQRGYVVSTPAGVEMVDGARVTAGFFRTLGVRPLLGRDFSDGEDTPAAPRTLMLSYASWQKRFGGKPEIVGQSITSDEIPYTVIGVLPQNFHFAPVENAEFFVALNPIGFCFERRSCHSLHGIARLKDGVSIEAALADVTRIAKDLEAQYPDSNRNQGALVLPLS